MAYHMWLALVPTGKGPDGRGKWRNATGNTECVELIRQTTSAPHTSRWRPGVRVMDTAPGDIPPYTAIATFDKNGRYPTDNNGKHAALYLSHNKSGIRVIDQWNNQGEAKERTIRFGQPPGRSRSNDGSTFWVIESE